MVEILIDGRTLSVAEGTTVLEAAKRAGIDIPHFCYHPAFPPDGSCRMCLIEVEGQPKLELACSTVVRAGLKILTACLPVAFAGLITAIYQGKVSASGIMMAGKRPEMAFKAGVVYAVMVEIYAILGLLTTMFMLLKGIPWPGQPV